MLNRRLIVLFVLFTVAFLALGLRLARLQLVDAAHWQEELRAFIHHHRPIETYRGSILDRNGLILARDVPCDELAIDYRAMNLDDAWLKKAAQKRLESAGEKLPKGAAGLARLAQVKDDIAAQIRAIPDVVSRVCQMPKEDVLLRIENIRERIHVLREDIWSRKYQPNAADDRGNAGNWWGSSDPASDLDDLDTSFRDTEVRDEVIAHTIVAPLSTDAANYFRQHAADFPGLIVRDNANRRDYPFAQAAAHVVGTLRSVDAQHFDANKFRLPNLLTEDDTGNLGGYLPGDDMGESGVERLLEDQLRGSRGARLVDLADSGNGATTEQSRHVDPLPGKDVRLTLDMALQKDMFNSLLDPAKHLLRGEDGKDHFAAIVVMRIEDGQILAMLSLPSYDPNNLDANRKVLQSDRYRTPLVNRVTGATYQPGSTIKPLLAAAALTDQVITPQTTIVCSGSLYPNRPDVYRCDEIHGPLQLVDAIAKSCDVYFYTVGRNMGLERLAPWFDHYGFGRATGLELPDVAGTYPKPQSHPDADDAARLAIFAGIGQGGIVASPMQMANAYATLLRGGVAITPRILLDSPLQQTQAFHISPEVLSVVRQGMEGCITSGTAKDPFRGFHLPVAGKTGTAQTVRPAFDDDGNPISDPEKPLLNPDGTPTLGSDGKPRFRQAVRLDDDAWFVGYAPAEKPQYIVTAIMEFGGFGGKSAAPMVRETFTLLQQHNYLPKMDVR